MQSSEQEELFLRDLEAHLAEYELSFGHNIHVRRLHRAFSSRPNIYSEPDLEGVQHFISRIGVFARYIAEELDGSEARPATIAAVHRYLEEVCNAAFDEISINRLGGESGFPNEKDDGCEQVGSKFLNWSGRTCLDRVEERDIDLLLLEELTCEPDLQSFVAQLVFGTQKPARFLEISNSVSTASGGESDLIARYDIKGEVVAILIENKISAPFMPLQADRYRRRGASGISSRHWNRYVTCLLAPNAYLEGDHGEHIFDHEISYETLRPLFEARSDTVRGKWRTALLDQAIEGARSSNYVRVVDEATSAFFRSYWKYASQHFPSLRMPHERDRPATSTWVQFRPDVDVPKRVALYHKARYGTVDIQISGCRVEDVAKLLGDAPRPEMHLEQTGKSVVIRQIVPKLDASQKFEDQENEVHVALEAAHVALDFLREGKDRFWKLA